MSCELIKYLTKLQHNQELSNNTNTDTATQISWLEIVGTVN